MPASGEPSHDASTGTSDLGGQSGGHPEEHNTVYKNHLLPWIISEGLVCMLDNNMADFAMKLNLLCVSKGVHDVARLSITSLKGDERVLPFLAKFKQLRRLHIMLCDNLVKRGNFPAVELSKATPLLEDLKVWKGSGFNADLVKSSKCIYQEYQERQTAEVEAELAGMSDEMLAGERFSMLKSSRAVAGRRKERDWRLRWRTLQKVMKRRREPQKEMQIDAEVDLDLSARIKEPLTRLTGLRGLRSLKCISIQADTTMVVTPGIRTWMEEELPMGLERLSIHASLLEGPLLPAVARRVRRAGGLPCLRSLSVHGVRRHHSEGESEVATCTLEIIELLTSLTQKSTPSLEELVVVHSVRPSSDIKGEGKQLGWLDFLVKDCPAWERETQALRGWWSRACERPPHLYMLGVRDGLEAEGIPRLMCSGDPDLVALGTLMCCHMETMQHLYVDSECFRAMVGQFQDCHPIYARAHAVRALINYIVSQCDLQNGDIPISFSWVPVFKDLIHFVFAFCEASTDLMAGELSDPMSVMLVRNLIYMANYFVRHGHVASEAFQEDELVAVTVLAAQALTFRSHLSYTTRLEASEIVSRVFDHFMRQDEHARLRWESSVAAAVEKGLTASLREGEGKTWRPGVWKSFSPQVTPAEGTASAKVAVMMVRLMLVMFHEWWEFGREMKRGRVPAKDVSKYAQKTDKHMMSEIVSLMFVFLSKDAEAHLEALRAQKMLVSVVVVFLLDTSTPALLWFCSLPDIPPWFPGFMVDILLGSRDNLCFPKYLTALLTAGVKRSTGMQLNPSVNLLAGRRILLETLFAPERKDRFWKVLSRHANQVGKMTLFSLLAEAANRCLLEPGGPVGPVERQQLADAVNVLRLAEEGSSDALYVLRALKGEPESHLRDVLSQIQIALAAKTITGKPRPMKSSLFDELFVALAGLDANSLSTEASNLNHTVDGASQTFVSSRGTATCNDASGTAETSAVVLSSLLDATLTQFREGDLMGRLCDFIEGCKHKRTLTCLGTPQGKQVWKFPRLRILGAALSSLTLLSSVFVGLLAIPDTQVSEQSSEIRDADGHGARSSKDIKSDIKRGDSPDKLTFGSHWYPVARSADDFLDAWVEVLTNVEKEPVLILGLARAAVRETGVVRRLCKRAACNRSIVNRLARTLAMLSATVSYFPNARVETHVGAGKMLRHYEGANHRGGEREAARQAAETEWEGCRKEKESLEEGSNAREHPYVEKALSFGVCMVDPEAIIKCLQKSEEKDASTPATFRLDEHVPMVVMALLARPATSGAVLKRSVLVVEMLLTRQRQRVLPSLDLPADTFDKKDHREVGCHGPAYEDRAILMSLNGTTGISQAFDKHMVFLLQEEKSKIADQPGLFHLMRTSTVEELITYNAIRTLRFIIHENPTYVLPDVLNPRCSVGLRGLVGDCLQFAPAFAKACVESCLPRLLMFLMECGKAAASSWEMVRGIMKAVPDLIARVSILLLLEEGGKEEKAEVRQEKPEGGAPVDSYLCLYTLVSNWTCDRRVNRGDNKAAIEEFAALVPRKTTVQDPEKRRRLRCQT
ncbi:hypothetical protein Naga_100068g25 [Nannochloropsis gaditana]|uniref:Uncharacterized protein n=1 Tax=Nannochloropsis gaditana TaxID=72520 RepID=W7TFW3_9STRA|nr:hypothetical protein Naga_100068g25 [Nannochloropsis gaditana]